MPDKSKKSGIIDSQKDVGGWPELKSTTAPTDTDHDGMPDEWEKEHGLNAASAEDGSQDTDKDGYTNVEEYLNGTNPSEKQDYTNFGNDVGTISQRLSSEAG